MKQLNIYSKSGKFGKFGQRAQAGFTLIELIVVIVILGVLAATALPKFADLGGDARVSKMQAASGAMKSASATFHAQWLVAGSPLDNAVVINQEGVSILYANGYPTVAGMRLSSGLSAVDYPDATPLDATVFGVMNDVNHTGCTASYTPAASAGAAPSFSLGASTTTCK